MLFIRATRLGLRLSTSNGAYAISRENSKLNFVLGRMYLILGFNGAVLDYAITFCGVLCLVDNVAFKGVHCKSRTEAAGVLNRNVSDNVLVIPRLDNAPEQYLGLARSLAEAAPVK